MTTLSLNAPWRALMSVAKIFRVARGTSRCTYPLPRNLSDKMARDIGMSERDLEWHRFNWPSQSNKHPML